MVMNAINARMLRSAVVVVGNTKQPILIIVPVWHSDTSDLTAHTHTQTHTEWTLE